MVFHQFNHTQLISPTTTSQGNFQDFFKSEEAVEKTRAELQEALEAALQMYKDEMLRLFDEHKARYLPSDVAARGLRFVRL